MLYLRLTLDLIETGKLAPKSAGFKIIPVNISEVFLLMCNLRFTSTSSFQRVKDILAVALASLYPLRDDQIFQVCTFFNSLVSRQNLFRFSFLGYRCWIGWKCGAHSRWFSLSYGYGFSVLCVTTYRRQAIIFPYYVQGLVVCRSPWWESACSKYAIGFNDSQIEIIYISFCFLRFVGQKICSRPEARPCPPD